MTTGYTVSDLRNSLTKLPKVLDIINAYVPVPFGGKPYQASWKVNGDLTDVLIVIDRQCKQLVHFKLSEFTQWNPELTASTIISKLNELT